MPRIYCPTPLTNGAPIDLPPAAARHVQVLRMQPGETLTLFNGEGGEFTATILRMGRSDVQVQTDKHDPVEREAPCAVHLALGMPANDRMDWLIEKATELGVASIQPLVTERSVLRLSGDRATKKQAHWQSIAVAACEQSGRNRVPVVYGVRGWSEWMSGGLATPGQRLLLSFGEGACSPADLLKGQALSLNKPLLVVSGPEGGLSPKEEMTALDGGFLRLSLGHRVLRAETAPLALLAYLQLLG